MMVKWSDSSSWASRCIMGRCLTSEKWERHLVRISLGLWGHSNFVVQAAHVQKKQNKEIGGGQLMHKEPRLQCWNHVEAPCSLPQSFDSVSKNNLLLIHWKQWRGPPSSLLLVCAPGKLERHKETIESQEAPWSCSFSFSFDKLLSRRWCRPGG